MRAHAHKSRKRARARFAARARVYGSCARVRARIFTKKNLVITSYLMSKSLKFQKDPSFRSRDISLFVTMYDFELKILSFLKPQKKSQHGCGKWAPQPHLTPPCSDFAYGGLKDS